MTTLTQTIAAASTTTATATYTMDFEVSVSGTFTGLVYLERSLDTGTTWNTIKAFSTPEEGSIAVVASSMFRFRTGTTFAGSAKVYAKNDV